MSKPSRFKRFREENESSRSPQRRRASEAKALKGEGEGELDYMAPIDILLPHIPTSAGAEQRTQHTVSPGAGPPLSLAKLMETTSEQGMAAPLPTSSRGFQLLQKKGGYSEGQGLGREQQGVVEPLRVERRAHEGLGIAAVKQRRAARHAQKQEELQRLRDQLQRQFSLSLSRQHEELKLRRDIEAAAKVLLELDRQRGAWTHELSQILDAMNAYRESGELGRSLHELAQEMSAVQCDAAASEEEEEEEEENQDKRREDAEAKEAHDKLVERIKDATSILDFVEPTTDSLIDLLEHLRGEHHYCLYCGVKYDDERDMDRNCPGFFEDDH